MPALKPRHFLFLIICGCCLPIDNLNCTSTAALLSEDHHFLIWKVEGMEQRILRLDKLNKIQE